MKQKQPEKIIKIDFQMPSLFILEKRIEQAIKQKPKKNEKNKTI